MKALHDAWGKLAGRYAAISLRERRLIAIAAVLGPLMLGNALLVDPAFTRAKNVSRNLGEQQRTAADLRAQVENLKLQAQADPDAGKKAELAAMQKNLAAVDERLKALQSTLVAPEEMNGLLESLLARHAGLRLVSLKTLAPESIVPAPAATDGKPAPARQYDIYRHGVELRLEGSYLELLAYLDQLEKSDKKLLWGPLQFSVAQYPKAKLTLVVYTLGSDKTWLSI